MQDDGAVSTNLPTEEVSVEAPARPAEVVSTHVLVPEHQVERLRELSNRTRIHQSEYLREAVDDLLAKYGQLAKDDPKGEA
jgi:hypothetical protein